MWQYPTIIQVLAISSMCSCMSAASEVPDPLFRDLPPGVVVESSAEIAAAQRNAVGQKLGGKLERLANSIIRVHGRPIKVNTLTAADEASARAVHAAIAKTKSDPAFCLQRGRVVIEYTGKDIDAGFATKTSYELGLQPKPNSVRYRVTAQLATIDKADYMACTPLFQEFLASRSGDNQAAIQRISDLSGKFRFGHSLSLRNPGLYDGTATHQFQPDRRDSREAGAAVVYEFAELPSRHGVPFVNATIEATVDATAFRESTATPARELTAATRFWPADDPAVVALARRITQGKSTHGAKAMAILEWLTVGRNLKYAGQPGSRWGTAKVLQQGFGHCWDFSDCFVTLARAVGVPSRQVAGWLYCSDGHVWAEFYREGKGWQQVDPTGGGKLRCGIYHIPYFTTEDGEMPIVYVSMPKIECLQMK